jgi:hypothetical protein
VDAAEEAANSPRGCVAAVRPRYRCTDPRAMLVPVAEITAPVRKLNPDALRSLLRGVRDGDDLPRPWSCFVSPERPQRRCSTAYTVIGCLSRWASHRYRRRSRVGRMRRRSIGMGKYEACAVALRFIDEVLARVPPRSARRPWTRPRSARIVRLIGGAATL